MKINPEKEAVKRLAEEICVAARTAPKAKGLDSIVTGILEKEDIPKVIKEMEKIAKKRNLNFPLRDAENLKNSDACVIIGVKNTGPLGLNCGACGFDCEKIKKAESVEMEYIGPMCAFKLIDLGIALGSGVRKAQDLCLDNRVMYSIGAGVRRLGILDADVILGIPLSAKGKNIFFDRK